MQRCEQPVTIKRMINSQVLDQRGFWELEHALSPDLGHLLDGVLGVDELVAL